MDIAALSLEDAFPELSPEQVRSALAKSMGNLALAQSFCERMLFSAQAGSGRGATAGAAAGAGTGACGPAPQRAPGAPSPQHRRWWPVLQLPLEQVQAPLSTAPLAGGVGQRGLAASAGAAPPLPPPQLIPVQVISNVSRPTTGVRVLQHHNVAGQQGAGAQLANGAPGSTGAGGKPAQGIHYAGVFLFEDSRDRVLQFAPPLHEAVSADHMTLAYAPPLQQCLELPLGRDAPLFVEGVVADYRAQALAVQHPSWLPFLSESVPHVTVSVAEGVPAKEAGNLVRAAKEGTRARVVPLVGVKLLHGRVGVKLIDGTVAYSEEELREGLQALSQRAPALDTAAPVRILRRGDAVPPGVATPSAMQPSPQQQAQPAQLAPPAPPGAAGGAGGVSLGVAVQQEACMGSLSSPEGSVLTIQSHTSVVTAAAVAAPEAAPPPSLDDLLDMLHLEDTAGPSPAATPAAAAPSAAAKSSRSPATRAAAAGRASSSVASASSAAVRQVRTVSFAAPYRPPGLLARGVAAPAGAPAAAAAAASGEEPSCQPVAAPASSRAPPSLQQLQPRQQPALAAVQSQPAGSSFTADLEVDDGGSLDLLSALADRLGSQPQQAQQVAPPISSPPSFNPLPLFTRRQQQQQQASGVAAAGEAGGPKTVGPKAPAPARTLADFLPTSLAAATPPSPQVPPPPPPFFTEMNPPVSSSPPSSLVTATGGPLRSEGSGTGYESSSSSAGAGEMAVPVGGPPPQTERDLQRAFPGVEAEILAAALEIYGGDVSETASFLTALQLEQQACVLASAAAGAVTSEAGSLHALPAPSQPSRPPPPPGGRPPGQRKHHGGRGPKHQRGHTGASDPLAVAERQAMSLHLAAKNMYEKAARAAASRGKHALAQELSATSHHHAEVSSAARRRANSTAFRTSNSQLTNTFKVDLHGLHVEEALQVLERHLVGLGGLGHPGGIILEVVTGVGRHSSAGQPRLLPAVVRFLSDAGYRFDTQEGNTGVVLVFIGC